MPPTEPRQVTWRPRDQLWPVAAALSTLGLLAWVIPALMMADRGFSIADEGTYVVTYRDWANPSYFESGAQYFYGPLFHLIGQSIPWLRIVRLLMALAANAWWGWAFVTWLQEYRRTRVTRRGRLALVLVITAAGSPAYLWSPLTPGYYDLTAVITLNLATLMFLNARRTARGASLGAAPAVAAGMLSVVLLFTKWPAVTVVAVTEVAALFFMSSGEKHRASRGTLRHLLGFVVGVLAMAAILQVWVHPVGDSAAVLFQVTSTRSGGAGGPSALLRWYAADTFNFVVAGVLFALPAAMVVAIGFVVARRHGPGPMTPWILGAMALLGVALPLAAGWRGGGSHGRAAFAAVTGALFIACAAGLVGRGLLGRRRVAREGDAGTRAPATPVICCLVILPVLQALGTSIPLVYEAFECLALWVAGLILLISGPFALPALRFLASSALATAIGVSCVLAGTTTLLTPFKTSGYAASTASLPGAPDIRISPPVAAEYNAVITALTPYLDPTSPSPFYALDRLSGLVYLIGGEVIGSPWTDASDPDRSATLLALACHRGDVDRARPPVVLADRPIDVASMAALKSCGFPFPSGYVQVPVVGGPAGLRIWVPRGR